MHIINDFVWNIPNVISLVRLVSVPISVIPLLPLGGGVNSSRATISLVFLIIGCASDFFDGYFARKLKQSTAWGTYIDPLIDKVLIWALYGSFVLIPFLRIPVWICAVIILRDVIVTQLRNRALREGWELPTSFLAKIKTAVQMSAGILILIYAQFSLSVAEIYKVPNVIRLWSPLVQNIPFYLLMGVALFTIYTLIDYFLAYRKLSSQKK